LSYTRATDELTRRTRRLNRPAAAVARALNKSRFTAYVCIPINNERR